jgi:hypothetical protein
MPRPLSAGARRLTLVARWDPLPATHCQCLDLRRSLPPAVGWFGDLCPGRSCAVCSARANIPPSSAIPPWLIRTRTTSQRPCCWSVSAPTAGEPSQLHGASGAGRRSPERKRGRRTASSSALLKESGIAPRKHLTRSRTGAPERSGMRVRRPARGPTGLMELLPDQEPRRSGAGQVFASCGRSERPERAVI